MMVQSAQSERAEGGTVFGFPLKGFGLFTSLLLAFAAAFFTFSQLDETARNSILIYGSTRVSRVEFGVPPNSVVRRSLQTVGQV